MRPDSEYYAYDGRFSAVRVKATSVKQTWYIFRFNELGWHEYPEIGSHYWGRTHNNIEFDGITQQQAIDRILATARELGEQVSREEILGAWETYFHMTEEQLERARRQREKDREMYKREREAGNPYAAQDYP